MKATDVVRVVVETLPRATLVSSLGTATSAVRSVTDDGPHLYFGAAMGSTMAAALGLAEGVPDREVVAVIGDGDFLMGASALWSLSACRPTNLLVVVLADGTYTITGAQPISVPLRVEGVCSALDGLSGAAVVACDELADALARLPRPAVVEAAVTASAWPGPSPFVDPAEVVRNLRRSLGR